MWRPPALIALGPLDRGGRHQRDPQAAVGGEALLRREVVDVGLGDVDRQARRRPTSRRPARARRRRSPSGRATGHHDAGGGLVVRPRVDVDARRSRAGRDGSTESRLDDLGVLQERRRRRRRWRTCAVNSPCTRCWRPALDQAERRGVEEGVRAADAEDDLVAVGQREQLGEALAQAADEVLDRRLPVRRAHQRVAGRGECGERLGADLGRAGPEASVAGQQLGGDLHAPISQGGSPVAVDRVWTWVDGAEDIVRGRLRRR